MRSVAVLVVALFLAGCSTGPDASEPALSTPSSTSAAPVSTGPAPILLTDTLHLQEAPHLAGAAPTATEPIRVPIQSDSPTAQHALWTLPRPDGLDLIDASVRIWVDVQGSVVNTAADGCFWNVFLLVEGGDGLRHVQPMCANEPPIVPAGIRELRLQAAGFDIRDLPGTEVLLQVSMNAAVAPGSTVDLLTGTPEHDSSLTIAGLQLPLSTQTLLQ